MRFGSLPRATFRQDDPVLNYSVLLRKALTFIGHFLVFCEPDFIVHHFTAGAPQLETPAPTIDDCKTRIGNPSALLIIDLCPKDF
jgi:hypothetical protein